MSTIIPEWHADAACADHGADPALSGLHSHDFAPAAAEYCAGCPVVRECAREALRNHDVSVVRAGVFLVGNGGSMRPRARRALQRIAGGA